MKVYQGEATKSGELSAEQAKALERWLFDESPVATYEQARGRLLREFGVQISNGAVGNFYQKRSKARLLDTAVALGKAGHPAWGELGKNEVQAHRFLMEVAGRLGFEVATSGEKLALKDLMKVARLAATGLAADQGAKRLRLKEAEVQLKARLVAIREREEKRKQKMAVAKDGKKQKAPEWREEVRMAA